MYSHQYPPDYQNAVQFLTEGKPNPCIDTLKRLRIDQSPTTSVHDNPDVTNHIMNVIDGDWSNYDPNSTSSSRKIMVNENKATSAALVHLIIESFRQVVQRQKGPFKFQSYVHSLPISSGIMLIATL